MKYRYKIVLDRVWTAVRTREDGESVIIGQFMISQLDYAIAYAADLNASAKTKGV